MKSANIPKDEAGRLSALLNYNILDTEPECQFDELTELASSVCETPITLVSLIDETRQWFKSHHGLDATETPRELAFCSHAILQDDIFEIRDSRQDERFSDNPLVTGEPRVIFYAGAPLVTPEGHHLGTLCVIDNEPKTLSPIQRRQLRIIANQVMAQLELSKSNRLKSELVSDLRGVVEQVNQKNDDLSQFAHRVAHDIGGPLRQISSFSELSIKDVEKGDNEGALKKYHFIISACSKLKILVNDILNLSKAGQVGEVADSLNLDKIFQEVISDVNMSFGEHNVDIEYTTQLATSPFCSEAVRIKQILHNLISNGIKYSNPEQSSCFVKITAKQTKNGLQISVKDNGLGIPEKYQDNVYQPFKRFHPSAAEGSGLGTAIVKKHIDVMSGRITLLSDEQGTEFIIYLPNIG